MPKIVIIVVCLMMCLQVNGQKVISNGGSPLNKNAGGIVKLKMSAFSHDNDGEYIFKHPRNIAPTGDGNFFVIDNHQVLRFDKNGLFSRIVVRKGQGPGEATHVTQIFVHHDKLIVNTGFMGKLMYFDLDGNLISEFTEPKSTTSKPGSLSIGKSIYSIIGRREDNHFLAVVYSPGLKKEDKDNVKSRHIFLLSPGNEFLRELFQVPLRAFTVDSPAGKKQLAVMSLISTSDDKYLYYCNTERYEIKKYNMEKNVTEIVWKRAFKPVPIPDAEKQNIAYGETLMGYRNGKSFKAGPPPRENYLDIQEILVFQQYIWVVTSYVENNKGVLVDVFDPAGKYMDNFYLSFGENRHIDLSTLFSHSLSIKGERVYLRQKNDDGNYLIGIYELPGQGADRN